MWAVLAIAVLIVVGLLLRRRAMRRFASIGLLKHLAPHISEGRKRIKAVLYILTMALIVLGLVDIRWGKVWTDVPQRGVDIIFALDVSRSMLAQDVSPDRLTRAKEYIRDMMEEMGGDRVGLVTFAGKTKQLVPLTSNYSDVNIALDSVTTQSVSRGGSLLGDAIRTAADGFVDKTADHKAIVVITDGEDQESYPVEAAKKIFKEKGIRVYTVGLGDRKTGARIPVQTSAEGKIYLKYNDQEVWSKMDGKILEQTALAGGGAYIPAGTKHVDMADVYDQHIRSIQQREFRQARVNRYIPRFQWFLCPAVLLLLIESLIAASRKPRFSGPAPQYASDDGSAKLIARTENANPAGGIKKSWVDTKKSGNPRLPMVLIVFGLAVVLAMSASAWAEEAKPSELVRTGNQALAAGDADKALAAFQKAQEAAKAQGQALPEVSYNQAVALYRKGEYEKAQERLRETLTTSQAELEAKARFNMGNCEYAAALPLAQKDKKQSIEHLNQAIKHYRDALAIDGNDSDTRANIELAQMLIEKLKKEQKQEDKKKQDQKQQDKKDQQQNKDKNQEQKNDKQNKDQNKNQDQDKKKDQQKKKDEQKQNQKNKEQQDKKQQQEQDKQSKPDEKKQQKNDQQKDKNNEQAKDKQNQDKKEQQQEQQAQPKPDKPEKGDKKQQPKDANGQPGAQQQPKPGQPKKMSPEEAAKLLQAVRDKNLKRRKEQMQNMKVWDMPVKKDW